MLDPLSDIPEPSSSTNRELSQNTSQSEMEIMNVSNSENNINKSVNHATVKDTTSHPRQENEQPHFLPISTKFSTDDNDSFLSELDHG